ncbi:hypothetical protein P9112_006744 [Eukaryota sp. TZLM1-RC]
MDESSSVFHSTLNFTLDQFSLPESPLPLAPSDLESSLEEQLFSNKGGGNISVIWAVKAHVFHHSKKKKEDKIVAIVRHYSATYATFIINPIGWRGNRYSINDVIPITDYPQVSKSTFRKPKDDDSVVVCIDFGCLKLEVDLSTPQLYTLYTAFSCLCDEMFSSSPQHSFLRRVSSVEWTSSFLSETREDTDHSVECVSKLLSPSISQSLREDLITELCRSILSKTVCVMIAKQIKTCFTDRTSVPGIMESALLVIKAMVKTPHNDLNLVKELSLIIEKAKTFFWNEGSLGNLVGGLAGDLEQLEGLLPFPDLDVLDDVVPQSKMIADVMNKDFITRKGSFFEGKRHELGNCVDRNSLTLFGLVFNEDFTSILVDSDWNPPNQSIVNPCPSNMDRDHPEFTRILSLTPSLPLYSNQVKIDPFPLRSCINNAYVTLTEELGNLDLGFTYADVINLTLIDSVAVCTVTSISTNDLPFECASGKYEWIPFREYEHDFYFKYLRNFDFKSRVSTMDNRFLSMIVEWYQSNHITRPLSPGFYLGCVQIVSDLNGLHIVPDRDNHDHVPLVLIDNQLPTAEEAAWLQTVNYKLTNGDEPLCPSFDPNSKYLNFEQKFVLAVDKLKQKLGFDDLGEFYDWEMIPINQTNQSKMMVFIKLGSEQDLLNLTPLESFEIRHFTYNFNSFVNPLYRKSDQLVSLEACQRLEAASYSQVDDFAEQTSILEKISNETILLERAFSIIRWITRLVTWVLEGSTPVYEKVDNHSSLCLSELGALCFELVQQESQRLLEQFDLLLSISYPSTFDSMVSSLQVLWSRYDREDQALLDVEDSDVMYQPKLKPIGQVAEVKVDEVVSRFSLYDLADHVDFELTGSDICLGIVEEIVESVLVEVIDVPELIEIEDIISENVELLEIMDLIVEEAALITLENHHKALLIQEQEKFRSQLVSLFSQPLPSYEACPITGRKPDAVELLKTCYTDFIKDQVAFFNSTVNHVEMFFERLNDLHDFEEKLGLLDEGYELAQVGEEGEENEVDDAAKNQVVISLKELVPEMGQKEAQKRSRKSLKVRPNLTQSPTVRKTRKVKSLSSPTRKNISGLRHLNSIYGKSRRKPGSTRDDFNQSNMEVISQNDSRNDGKQVATIDQLSLIIQGSEFLIPKSLLTECLAINQYDQKIEIDDVSPEAFELVLKFLENPALARHDPMSDNKRAHLDLSRHCIEILMISELLKIPFLFIFTLDFFINSIGDTRETFLILKDSFFVKTLSLNQWFSLELSHGLPVFDLFWFVNCYIHYPSYLSLSSKSDLSEVVEIYYSEQGEWCYSFCSFKLTFDLLELKQDVLGNSKVTEVWNLIGERIFSLKLANFTFLNDELITLISEFCPNLLYIDLSNTKISHLGLENLVTNCDLLKEVTINNSKLNANFVLELQKKFNNIAFLS